MDFLLWGKFLAVVLLDMVFGDPRWLPHPVRIMGSSLLGGNSGSLNGFIALY